MKRLLFAGLLGFAFFASALPPRLKYEMASCPGGLGTSCIAAQACSAGTCTGTAPSTSSEGMSIAGVGAFRLTICAASGQTLSGAGTMQAWVYETGEALWARDSSLDQSVTLSGKQCSSFPDLLVGVQDGRVRFVASGVTVSAGSGLDVLLDATSYAR